MITKIEKPWGYELIWGKTENYVGKVLHIAQGHKLSRQFHNLKEETFLVQSGEMMLEIGLKDQLVTHHLKAGDNFHCPPKTVHRMIAITDVDVIEVSTNHLDDVVRLEDDYGR